MSGKRLISTALLALATTGVSGVAFAAEPTYAPPAFSWTGVYLGGTIGYSSATFDVSNILFEGAPGIPDFSFPGDGVIGGVEGGFNAQFGNVVAGVEGDFSWTGVEGSYTDTIGGSVETGRLKTLATIRGRLGLAMDRFLIFGTGGVAFGNVEGQIDDSYPPDIVTTIVSQNHTGWTAGGGVEVAVTDHLTIKGEGLYYDLGSQSYAFYEGGPPGWNPITLDAAITGWLARLGANVKF
jgi:outer membrane immunogenic protein